MRRVTRKPSVIAGLKWPPEMCPTADTITAIAKPFASATPVSVKPPRDGSCCGSGENATTTAMIEPAPAKTSANVPTNSAMPRRSGSWSIAANVRAASDGEALRGPDRLVGDASRPHGGECVLERAEDRERGAESRQIQDLMDERVIPVREDEREAERGFLGPVARGEQNTQRRGVDEGCVAKIDDDALSPVEEDGELVLEPL